MSVTKKSQFVRWSVIPNTSGDNGGASSPVGPVVLSLAQLPPRDVAKELCLMDAEVMRKIMTAELDGGAWTKPDKMVRAPNIMAMVHASNSLAQLVPTEVLREPTIAAMARTISAFIKIASKCHRMNNYNSLKAILAGLQCTPVYRLKNTWTEVPNNRKRRFEYLSRLMAEERNWGEYRRTLHELLDTTTPCIPFLGVLLTTTVQYQCKVEGRQRKESGVEDYTLLDAVTDRMRLESLRSRRSTSGYSLSVLKEDVDPVLPVPGTPRILCDSTESLPSCDSPTLTTPSCDSPTLTTPSCDSPTLTTVVTLTRAWSELNMNSLHTNNVLPPRLTRSCTDLTLNNTSLSTPPSPLPVTSPTLPVTPSTPLTLPVTTSPTPGSLSPRKRNRSDCMSESKRRQFSVEVPPEVLKRRRPSTLLTPLRAGTPYQQLSCYQLLSLGVTAPHSTNTHIRDIIVHSHTNTEAVNYKLSYLREP